MRQELIDLISLDSRSAVIRPHSQGSTPMGFLSLATIGAYPNAIRLGQCDRAEAGGAGQNTHRSA